MLTNRNNNDSHMPSSVFINCFQALLHAFTWVYHEFSSIVICLHVFLNCLSRVHPYVFKYYLACIGCSAKGKSISFKGYQYYLHHFEEYEIKNIPRSNNRCANTMASVASLAPIKLEDKQTILTITNLSRPSNIQDLVESFFSNC